jgi:hypothetical protein
VREKCINQTGDRGIVLLVLVEEEKGRAALYVRPQSWLTDGPADAFPVCRSPDRASSIRPGVSAADRRLTLHAKSQRSVPADFEFSPVLLRPSSEYQSWIIVHQPGHDFLI